MGFWISKCGSLAIEESVAFLMRFVAFSGDAARRKLHLFPYDPPACLNTLDAQGRWEDSGNVIQTPPTRSIHHADFFFAAT